MKSDKMKYDLAIAYRIYPKVSKVPPVYADDKYKLSELCLSSLKDSLGDLKVKFFAILDSCPLEYEELFKKYFNSEDLEIINVEKAGNAKTFEMQVNLLLEQQYSNNIYFAEDDYFYTANSFHEMLEFMKNNEDAGFVSAYDHLDYYEHPLHEYEHETRNYKNRKWKTAATACLTFLTTKDKLKVTKKSFLSYSNKNYDNAIWMSITKYKIKDPIALVKLSIKSREMLKAYIKGWIYTPKEILFGEKLKLWIPVPSIATHMDSKHLAPHVDWWELFKQKII